MEQMFKKEWLKASDYPNDFIPAGAEVFVGVDFGSPDGDCTVKGFYDRETGEFHIQEVAHNDGGQRGRASADSADRRVGRLFQRRE